MENPKKEYGTAPINKSSEKKSQNLDAMIVIPAMDEGTKIIDTIYTAIRQRDYKDMDVDYGVIVVINNRPNSNQSVKINNFKTYLLLQALEHKFPIKLGGSNEFNKKIKYIQSKNVPIHVLDAFSDDFASSNSNVGRARRIGTQHALDMVKPEGFIVSTDADTVLGDLLMVSTKNMFEIEDEVVGTRLAMTKNLFQTNLDEKRASSADDMCYGLSQCVDTKKVHIEEGYVWMAGGGSAFRAKNYKILSEKGKGYLDIPGHEDRLLGSAFADEGWVVRDMSEHYKDMWVSTRQRFSDRASVGYGQRTLGYDQNKTKFKDITMDSVEFIEQKDRFLKKVQNIYYKDLIPNYKEHPEKPIDELYLVFHNYSIGNNFVNEFIDKTHTEAIEKFTALCFDSGFDKEDTDKLVEAFKIWRPNQEMSLAHHDFIELVKALFEKKYPKESVESFFEKIKNRTKDRNKEDENSKPIQNLLEKYPNFPWLYKDFEEKVLEILNECAVQISDPDILLKARTIIISRYQDFYDEIKQYFQSEVLRAAREDMIRKGRHEHADIMFKVEVPRDFILRKLKWNLMNKTTKCVNDIRNSLLWDNSKEVSEIILKKIVQLGKEASDFYSKEVESDLKDIVETSPGIIDLVRQKLDEIDDKENKK